MTLARSSGILLHITSLPSSYGIGDFGPEAYQFADFLVRTGQSVWQVLPLVPVGHGNSPYSSPSTFAGNPLLISPELLRRQGLVWDEDLSGVHFSQDRVDYDAVVPFREMLLTRAFERFEAGQASDLKPAFEQFCKDKAWWLKDYALFMSLKGRYGMDNWTGWHSQLIHRYGEVLEQAHETFAREIRKHSFWQFLFHRQWHDLKRYCNDRGIRIFGDLPIYVAHDSADVWSHQDLFFLDDDGSPTVVAGVPPDYFSQTGQRWGNPLYRWDVMKHKGYEWWTRRLAALFDEVDLLRLDHFRGFEAYWEIPASEPTAVNGRWVEGPGSDLFDTIQRRLGELPLIAEDLGLITQGVRDLMDRFRFPGMAVLQFAFDSGPFSTYLPHHHQQNLIVYTGTHDNDTTLGWWQGQLQARNEGTILYTRQYLGLDPHREAEINWEFIRLNMASVAELTIQPLQDVLGLGTDARMNIPGVPGGNWSWRYRPEMLNDQIARRLKDLTEIYGRVPRR